MPRGSVIDVVYFVSPDVGREGRLRLILGEVDRKLQSENHKSEPVAIKYEKLEIEHLIPQSWPKTWPIFAADPNEHAVKTQEREDHIHRIGNLTLTSDRLNPAMGNDPWLAKREELKKHSSLRLNARLCQLKEWDEPRIRERGAWLAQEVDSVWPGPERDRWPF